MTVEYEKNIRLVGQFLQLQHLLQLRNCKIGLRHKKSI